MAAIVPIQPSIGSCIPLNKKFTARQIVKAEYALAKWMEHFAEKVIGRLGSGAECRTGEAYFFFATSRNPDGLQADIEDAVAQFAQSWSIHVTSAYAAQAGQTIHQARRRTKLFWRAKPRITKLAFTSSRRELTQTGQLRTHVERREGFAIYARAILTKKPMRRKR